MNTNRELNYRLFVQIEEEFIRTDIKSEFEVYDDIKNGNVEQVQEKYGEISLHYYDGKGVLSDSLLRNNQYHFAIGTGIIARVCIDGGMQHNVAYTLADIYIRKCDRCTRPEEVIELTGEMALDYAKRMQEIRKADSVSLHVRRTIEYIYQNLGGNLTLKMAAEHEKLNQSYLSKLFAQEMGIPIKAYILKARINTAKNILTFSDFSVTEIAAALGFSSQSAFSAAFRKLTGLTPQQYRRTHSDIQVCHLPDTDGK